MNRVKDISGQQFGVLKVVRWITTNLNGDSKYLCECTNCGKVLIKRLDHIKSLKDNKGCPTCLGKRIVNKKLEPTRSRMKSRQALKGNW